LSKPPRVSEIEWGKLRIYWGDERFVPNTEAQSNYRLAAETLLANLPEKPRVFAVDTSYASPEDSAKAYAEEIRKQEQLAPDQSPEFDIVLLGLGEDGHTASLFPGLEILQAPESESDPISLATQAPDGSPRISLSPKSLVAAKKVLFIVSGPGKASIVRKILQEELDPEEYPAALFRKMGTRVTWMLDSSAASLLEKAHL
jgi:6-phosphogluconolactonase